MIKFCSTKSNYFLSIKTIDVSHKLFLAIYFLSFRVVSSLILVIQPQSMKRYKWTSSNLIHLWNWLFPKKVELSKPIKLWLNELFPQLDFKRVKFYKGLPPIIKKNNPNAIVLPSLLGFQNIKVYFKDGPDFCSSRGLGLIAHEMVHVRQYLDFAGGYGLGFARLFMMPYLLSAIKGYSNIPLEIEAYDFGDQVEHALKLGELPCDCNDEMIKTNLKSLEIWKTHHSDLKMEKSSINFWRNIWTFVPGLNTFWKWGESIWKFIAVFYQKRLKQLGFIPSKNSFASATPLHWTRDFVKKLSLVWIPIFFISIFNTLTALIIWSFSVHYFLIANIILTIMILVLAIFGIVLDVLGLIVFVLCAFFIGIEGVFTKIFKQLKNNFH